MVYSSRIYRMNRNFAVCWKKKVTMCILKGFLFLILCVWVKFESVESHVRCFHSYFHQDYTFGNLGSSVSAVQKTYLPAYQSYGPQRTSSSSAQRSGNTCEPARRQQCDPRSVYYTYDGSCNNLQNPSWGQAGTQYSRYMPANYADSKCAIRKSVNGRDLPIAREIRTTLLKDRETLSRRFNILYYGFGQWVDHDNTAFNPMNVQNSCCSNGRPVQSRSPSECIPLILSDRDQFYSKFRVTCIDVKRANNTHALRCDTDKPCVPINFQTGLLDLSILYGPSPTVANDLRLFKGGFLKFTNNSMTQYQTFPPVVNGEASCPLGGIDNQRGGYCMKTGDIRVNQNPEIAVIELLFYRLHQYIATVIGNLNSGWKDERIYQETRRHLIAAYQHIIYNEYVPITVGYDTATHLNLLPRTDGYAIYNPQVNPQTLAEYSFAVGRAPHSLIRGTVAYKDSRGSTRSYMLRDKYFNQRFLLDQNIVENLLQSFVTSDSSAQDEYGSEEISNYLLFNRTNRYGSDLQAVDILRGLDSGLPTYNDVRQYIGLPKLYRFDDLLEETSNYDSISKLSSVYYHVDDVDLYIGGLLEKPLGDSSIGATFTELLGQTFYRWKFGDRLFYEFAEAGFSLDELREIRKLTFAYLLCMVNEEQKVPTYAFLIPSANNPLLDCRTVLQNGPNLKIWQKSYSTRYWY